ncbi:KAP family P-loop NTPase fold protein [Marinifilum flexuosum]|uniref:KAP-like P-loop domain-containing protein n=1 Tax=Marinifilum flexuosum TaxID=1117708 RepID=A0A419XAP6_9BACT|nr:P-loop NTPase fold protein [Marinifilum flexuosum]RKE04828.1 KAP-like P-loop domain-containing protein [Marinifilum flexuosum]
MKPIKKLILPLLLLFLLFGATPLIFDLIYEYPVKYIFDKIVWNNPVKALFVIIAFLLLWVQIRWIKIGYKASYNQWFAFGFVMGLLFFARFGDDWSFLKIEAGNGIVKWYWQPLIYNIKLIDILWLSLLYPLLLIVKRVFPKLYGRLYSRYVKIYDSISEKYPDFSKKETPQNENAFFEEDIALKDSDEQKFSTDYESPQYKKLTDVLVPKLENQKFKKAFSIGIIGPYGNGKSSLVNYLKDEFLDKLKYQRVEIIEFLPAYSHNPEQITTDFFTLLASKLKKYHGRLNQSMLTYAAKLLEVRFNGTKDIQGLLKPGNWFSENKSAIQAYQELEKIFTQIDIKTIVIIDDVDRLGKEEILQVLKIIRNTANFPNTIFIVAYDKDYVIKTIEQDLLYLDKYFQYELFVPPHRREELIQVFSELVLNKETGIESSRLEKVINLEILNKTLLDKFVFNYRDVKVLTNIYCTNLNLLTEEVDYIDLLHFTLLNRNFPKQVRYIYNNLDEIFKLDTRDKELTRFIEIKIEKAFDEENKDNLFKKLEIESDLSKKQFETLFRFLFEDKGDTHKSPRIEGDYESGYATDFENAKNKATYSPNKEFTIRNYERFFLYFELLLRGDNISNKDFLDKIETDDFEKYISDILSPLPDLKNKILQKKIEQKLKNYKKIDNKTKIKNAIWACHKVRGAYLESNLIDVLATKLIVNYPNALADIFGGDNDAFAAFFKKNLWDNPEIDLPYKIVEIIKLSDISSNDEGKPLYFGSSKEQIKEILISKTKEFIKEFGINIQVLRILAAVLDSSLNVTDGDIEFSDYLYTNQDQLFEYLKIVEKFYHEGFEFSSAIFKVFTPKDFKDKCFGTEGSSELKILIREFHHLLELHDLRKDNKRINSFTPFYFSKYKNADSSNSENQSVYVDCKKGGLIGIVSTEIGSVDIAPKKITDTIYLLEGKLSYLDLIEKLMPNFNHSNIVNYLEANKDNFEILSIQTNKKLDQSIISCSKYNKMIADLKEKTMSVEPVSLKQV